MTHYDIVGVTPVSKKNELVTTLITNCETTPEMLDRLREMRVQVIVADTNGNDLQS